MSQKETENENVIGGWRKVSIDGAEITLYGRLFQMMGPGPATGKIRLATPRR